MLDGRQLTYEQVQAQNNNVKWRVAFTALRMVSWRRLVQERALVSEK